MRKSTLEICMTDLYTPKEELEARYAPEAVNRVLRVREMYTWLLENPEKPDKEFVAEHLMRFQRTRVTAYDDLSTVRRLLPMIGKTSREFHRWRYNEIILDVYRKAQKKGDLKTMERCASSYAKFNNVEQPDDPDFLAAEDQVQPFVATTDPRVLGIEPIPDLRKKINELIEKYSQESMDIEDVDFEPADIEEEDLFPPLTTYDNPQEH